MVAEMQAYLEYESIRPPPHIICFWFSSLLRFMNSDHLGLCFRRLCVGVFGGRFSHHMQYTSFRACAVSSASLKSVPKAAVVITNT